MTTYLIVDANNTVVNVIDYDGVSPLTLPSGCTLMAGDGDIGWQWNGSAAVDPNPPPPPPSPTAAQLAQVQYASAITAGLTTSWTTSTALNGIYGIAQADQFNIDAEITCILLNGTFTNGQATKAWLDLSGVPRTFTIAQFKAFATAVGQYIDALIAAEQTAAAGQQATWPNATVTINQ